MKSKPPKTTLVTLPLDRLHALRRNPQYLTEKQAAALTRSIQRDGFLCPIIVRRRGEDYEILSGNHRVLSSREAGLEELPCVLVEPCDDKRAARIAINMNTVHGDPTPELLAPFLADVDNETLRGVFLDDALVSGIVAFDATLAERLLELQLPEALDNNSPVGQIPNCVCKCGHRHVAVAKPTSRRRRLDRKTIGS